MKQENQLDEEIKQFIRQEYTSKSTAQADDFHRQVMQQVRKRPGLLQVLLGRILGNPLWLWLSIALFLLFNFRRTLAFIQEIYQQIFLFHQLPSDENLIILLVSLFTIGYIIYEMEQDLLRE